jgi:hypothetical protein
MRTKTKTKRPSSERLSSVRDEIARRTAGLPDGSLYVDVQRFDDDEARELCTLTDQLFRSAPLDERDQARWNELVEQGADRPGRFAKLADERTLRSQMRELAARARRPAPQPKPQFEQPGTLILPAFLFAWLKRQPPAIHLEHLGLLSFVLLQLEAGECLMPHGRLEGDALVISTQYGLGSRFDPSHRFGKWQAALEHLATNDLLRVERRGGEIFVRRGRRLLDAAAKRRAAA